MYALIGNNSSQLSALSRIPIALASEAEPIWLRHRIEYARLQPLFEAEKKARQAEALREHRLVGRIRIVLGFA
ncbi:MAG: hypothetical protein ACRDG3_04870 [Tepidiformaceae bacterium]